MIRRELCLAAIAIAIGLVFYILLFGMGRAVVPDAPTPYPRQNASTPTDGSDVVHSQRTDRIGISDGLEADPDVVATLDKPVLIDELPEDVSREVADIVRRMRKNDSVAARLPVPPRISLRDAQALIDRASAISSEYEIAFDLLHQTKSDLLMAKIESGDYVKVLSNAQEHLEHLEEAGEFDPDRDYAIFNMVAGSGHVAIGIAKRGEFAQLDEAKDYHDSFDWDLIYADYLRYFR
jgi:hypothetical protein